MSSAIRGNRARGAPESDEPLGLAPDRIADARQRVERRFLARRLGLEELREALEARAELRERRARPPELAEDGEGRVEAISRAEPARRDDVSRGLAAER